MAVLRLPLCRCVREKYATERDVDGSDTARSALRAAADVLDAIVIVSDPPYVVVVV